MFDAALLATTQLLLLILQAQRRLRMVLLNHRFRVRGRMASHTVPFDARLRARAAGGKISASSVTNEKSSDSR